MRNALCVKGLEVAASIGKTGERKREGRVERKRASRRGRSAQRGSKQKWMAEGQEGRGGTMEWGRAETGPGLLGKCVNAYWSPSSTHNPLRQHLSPLVERRGEDEREGRGERRSRRKRRVDKLLQQFIFICRLSFLPLLALLSSIWECSHINHSSPLSFY